MIIQQRLKESQYNVKFDDTHNAFIVTICADAVSDEVLTSEAIKDIIFEIDTEAESKFEHLLKEIPSLLEVEHEHID